MNWREQIGVEELKRQRPPRAAIVIVAIGLLACVVAAVATAGKGSGEAAHLEWVQKTPLPDSKAVPVPGGTQTMQLVKGFIRSTGTNVSGYNLFEVASYLEIEAEAPVHEAKVLCAIHAPHHAEIGQAYGGLRALYPRSSEKGVYKQEVPDQLSLDFSSHGYEFAIVEVSGLAERFTNERGVKVEWPEFEEGTEHIEYSIAGKPKKNLVLPFESVWRSTHPPETKVSCTLTNGSGKATVESEAALKKPPPIDEEKEELEQERRQEEQSAAEGETDEAGGEGE